MTSNSSSSPSIYVSQEISKNVIQLMTITPPTGKTIRDGVELILKNDIPISDSAVDVGKYLQFGLSFLAQSPYETLDINPITNDENIIRKAYKKMALKYHPDKNPVTTPLFQAIHSAYEKLSNQGTVRTDIQQQQQQQQQAAATSGPPPGARPPDKPRPSTNERNRNNDKKASKGHDKERDDMKTFTESQQRAKMKERMKQESKRKEEEKVETQEENNHQEHESGLNKELREAEARAAERRAKTGYGNRQSYQPPQQRDHIQRKERSTNGEDYSKTGTNNTHSNSNTTPPPTATATATSSESSTSPPPSRTIPIPMGLRGEVVDVGTVQLEWTPISQWDPPPSPPSILSTKFQIELSWREILISNPNGYGQVYKSDPQWEFGSLMITGDKVMKRNLTPGSVYEFSIRYRIPASIDKKQQGSATAASSSSSSSSSPNTGEWCAEITVSIPYGRSSKSQNSKRPSTSSGASSTTSTTHNSEREKHVPTWPSSHSQANPLSQSQPIPAKNNQQPFLNQTGLFPQNNTPKYHPNAQLFDDDEDGGGNGNGKETAHSSTQSQSQSQSNTNTEIHNETSCSLYHKHFGSATSLPEEEEDDIDLKGHGNNDFVVPDVWVDDEESDDESPLKHKSKQTMQTKWYQLIPPDSHNGTGGYVHSVYLLKDLTSQIIGYISTANKVLASKRLSDWMFVKTHWNTLKGVHDIAAAAAAASASSTTAQTGENNLPWGWVRRCLWNERLGRDHVFFRPIPKSMISGLKYPTNKLSSNEYPDDDDEFDDSRAKRGPMGAGGAGSGGGGHGHKTSTTEQQEQEREEREDEEEDMNEDQFKEKMSKSFRRMANIPIWYEQFDESGNAYYYNPRTGESRWEPPEWVEEIDPSSGARYFLNLDRQNAVPLKSTWSIPHSFAKLIRQQR